MVPQYLEHVHNINNNCIISHLIMKFIFAAITKYWRQVLSRSATREGIGIYQLISNIRALFYL